MSKIALTPNASGSGTFTIAAPNSDTDRTLTLPDEAGTVLTTTNGVFANGFFHATMSTDQNISDTTFTKVEFDTESVDSDGWYDTSNYRFTPQTAGWYRFDCKLQFGDSSVSRIIGDIVKNGTGTGNNRWIDLNTSALSAGQPQFHGTIFHHLNGSTDYVEAFAWIDNTGSDQTLSKTDGVYFAGQLVRAD